MSTKRLRSTFIGLTDIEVEGDFKWADGANVTFTNWKIGAQTGRKPANSQGAKLDCVKLDFNPQAWKGVKCQNLGRFICEQPVTGKQT